MRRRMKVLNGALRRRNVFNPQSNRMRNIMRRMNSRAIAQSEAEA